MKKTQLFLLHFAGGNCYSYQFLIDQLSKEFEIHPLELPGRGKRMQESLLTDITSTTEDYYRQLIEKRNNQPYIIYGHSMGSVLGLYVSYKMEQKGDAPQKLIVTGSAGPTIGFSEPRFDLPTPAFKLELKKLGGIPEEVFEHQELFDFFSPVLRADFQVLEGNPLPNVRIETDIQAIIGDQDRNAHALDRWHNHTSGTVNCETMPGGHFFIHEHVEWISKHINGYS